jgi:hypothetical protein
MQFSKPHDVRSKDIVWASVESGQATSIAKGSLCAWDFTDNAAVSGIEMNTRGLRVIIYPVADAGDAATGVVRVAGFAHTAFDAVAANTRGVPVLIQVYGFRDDITANTDAASNIIQGGLIVPSGDAAGAVEGPQDHTAATGNEVSRAVGISFEAVAINTTATIQAFVRCL